MSLYSVVTWVAFAVFLAYNGLAFLERRQARREARGGMARMITKSLDEVAARGKAALGPDWKDHPLFPGEWRGELAYREAMSVSMEPRVSDFLAWNERPQVVRDNEAWIAQVDRILGIERAKRLTPSERVVFSEGEIVSEVYAWSSDKPIRVDRR